MKVENSFDCFVELWLRLERTRRLLGGQCKRFCARRVLKAWFGLRATDDFIWEVCHQATLVLSDEREAPHPRLGHASATRPLSAQTPRSAEGGSGGVAGHHDTEGEPASPRPRLQRGVPKEHAD